jgi:CHAT domain-containing protein
MLPAAIKKSTADFLHFFSDRNLILADPAGYAAAANSLYKYILGPYISKSNAPLLIIPDGFIAYIPFDALLTDPATSTGIASFPFLIKQQETYYAFSCKTLLEQEQYKNTAAENSITAFAPIFANKERGLTPLLHSNQELEAVKQFYPKGKFYTGNTATLKQFESNCADAGIIHLATHAGSGNGSAIAGIEFYDSTLYLNRVYSLPLKAKLVVLSGCETGIGTINKSEGLMSLARAFSYAGTKNVIAGLWQTEDNTSAEIFTNFYSNISDNNFSSALHKAKLSVINNATVTSASPFFWSGYIYIGSPAENLQPVANKNIKWLLLISGLLLIAVYLSYRKKKN